MTTVYILRHSLQHRREIYHSNDSFVVKNEKRILSVEGDRLAEKTFANPIFDNVSAIYASHYVRTVSTARPLSDRLDLGINIVDELGERVHGVDSYEDVPDDYERNQFLDENFKMGYGESRKEVTERMVNTIMKIVADNKDKESVVVSHATAITFLLMNWCNYELVGDIIKLYFKDKLLYEGPINNCEIFKLDFDNDNLIDIKLIK